VKTDLEKLHLSPILAFFSALLTWMSTYPYFANTPWQPFLGATGAFILALSVFLVSQGLITLSKTTAPNISPILAFLAGLFTTLADMAPVAGTPWQPFLHALAAFILALSLFLVAEGVITLRKLMKLK
jgi:hypothetical protein